jgi:hypothetical protein
LGPLATTVGRLRRTLRFVDYRQAERECEVLAARILRDYPRSELEGFTVRGIPRGGLIVLGMLSYMLHLDSGQLAGDDDRSRPLLLVDDCALSGARFHTALAQSGASRVLFAHLYSHPRLRAEIVQQEARVEACLAADDLVDHARDVYGDDYERWVRSARNHLGGTRYWLGLPDLVCFAWSEPDRPLWNPVSQRLERGWRLLPPHRCLKARADLGPPPMPIDGPTWRVHQGVASAREDGRLWLYCAETDKLYSLEGVAAEMWRVLATWGSAAAGAAFLAGRYDVSPERLRADLDAFAATLVEHRLLEG